MQTIITVKILAASAIFLVAFIAGHFCLKLANSRTDLLECGDAFASGVFLSAALLHLLPDAERIFQLFFVNSSYPLASLIALFAFVLLLVLERSIKLYEQQHTVEVINGSTPIFLMLLLTMHSLVEGAAIGTAESYLQTILLFIAVIAHKGSESFALALNLHRRHLTKGKIQQLIFIFALITPFGIGFASLVSYLLQTNSGNILHAIFNAIAAGTFIYLGTEHLIECKKSFETLKEIIALTAGIILMAVVAILV